MEDEEDTNKINTWKSCCFKIDKEFTKYLTQISISYIVLIFSIYKLITIQKEDNDDKSIYTSIIMMILGIYTNPVKFKRKTITDEKKN
jgi:hypothetical protein